MKYSTDQPSTSQILASKPVNTLDRFLYLSEWKEIIASIIYILYMLSILSSLKDNFFTLLMNRKY